MVTSIDNCWFARVPMEFVPGAMTAVEQAVFDVVMFAAADLRLDDAPELELLRPLPADQGQRLYGQMQDHGLASAALRFPASIDATSCPAGNTISVRAGLSAEDTAALVLREAAKIAFVRRNGVPVEPSQIAHCISLAEVYAMKACWVVSEHDRARQLIVARAAGWGGD